MTVFSQNESQSTYTFDLCTEKKAYEGGKETLDRDEKHINKRANEILDSINIQFSDLMEKGSLLL